MTDTCPTWPTLLAWLENDLPDEQSLLLNPHVPGCDECREKLALMNAVQDLGDVELEVARYPATPVALQKRPARKDVIFRGSRSLYSSNSPRLRKPLLPVG